MRFELPQFIQTEIKLIGPFTFKQFLWIGTGGAIIFLLFSLTQGSLLFWVIGIPVAILAIALAFMKVGEMPLFNYIVYALSYTFNPKKYVFKQDKSEITDYYKDNG